jgi:hypothetical protein
VLRALAIIVIPVRVPAVRVSSSAGVRKKMPVPSDRHEQLERLRQRVTAMRGDAEYWRRAGHLGTAAELEAVAAFVARLVDDLARILRGE